MNIFYLYVSARKKNEDLYKIGKYPDTLFYGLHYLRKVGHNVSYSDDAFSSKNILKYLFYPFEWLFIKYTGYGFKLDQAILLLNRLNDHDLIIACGISAGLPLGLLKLLRILKTPVICIQMGGVEKVQNSFIFSLLKRLYSHLEKILFFSMSEKELFKEKIKVNLSQSEFIPLGIDTNFFSPKKNKDGNYFLTVGKDLGRDFKYMLEIFRNLKLPLKLVTSKRNMVGLNLPDNVQVLYDIPYLELRELYNEAKAIILIQQPGERASGQLVFLESLAMSKPVIATSSPGLLSGYEDLKNIAKIINYGDKEKIMREILNIKAEVKFKSRSIIEKKYSSQCLGKSLQSLVCCYEK